MTEKYIRKNKDSFNIIKNSTNYGKFASLDDAIFFRDELVENSWNLELIDETYLIDGNYLVVKVIDCKIHILARYAQNPSPEQIDKAYKKHLRNPNNSKYGLNITRIFDTFVIKKRIAGDDYIFGYYDNLQDAEFVRNYLLEHSWNVSEFPQIQFDDETNTYKVTEVIDDKAYVLDSFISKEEIDIDRCHEDFLSKISKHKFKMANHDYLDELVDMIPDLEVRFNVKACDDVWSFDEAENPLNDIIFKLTPFQKSVYDAVDDSTFDEIKKSLIRFKSGNFGEKIQKNLDELINMGLIVKNDDIYKKL